MVTLAQAQERAESWVNGGVPGNERREARITEFDLGYVVWAQDRADGPTSDSGGCRLVIAHDGVTTVWPALPVEEVVRCYQAQYGAAADQEPQPAAPRPPRIDLEATSFLLTPPQWLQDAADKLGIPDHRAPAAPAASPEPAAADPAGPVGATSEVAVPQVPSSATPWAGQDTSGRPTGAVGWSDTNTGGAQGDSSLPPPAISGFDGDDEAPAPSERSEARTALLPGGSGLPATSVAPAVDPDGRDASQESDGPDEPEPPVPDWAMAPPAPPVPPTPPPGAAAAAPPPAPAPAGPPLPPPSGPAFDFTPPAGLPVPAPGAADIADAETAKAVPGGSLPPRANRPGPPGPPAPPRPPGASPSPAMGYVPTQLVPVLGDVPLGNGPATPPPPPAPGTPGGGSDPHAAATMLARPGGPPAAGPGAPPPPPPAPGMPQMPGAPGPAAPPPPAPGDPHAAATMLARPGGHPPGMAPPPPGPPAGPPVGGPGLPPPPPGPMGPMAPPGPPPGPMGPAGPMAPMAPMGMAPPPPPPGGAYGYPQPPQGVPVVGPGYMAVLRYRASDGSEQQIIRRSAPGTPHPEWQILHELRTLNVPPQQVLELHTELESCDLPGGYCARMIRETWPQVRVSHTAPYGRDHASRQQGVQHLLTHQGELAQVADGPARPRPQRVPLPGPGQVQQLPAIPLDGIGHELAQAFGPQAVFRFDQRAVARQGVPDIVAQTLVWSGLPVDFGPFFWARAQPGMPVPTLAEVAAERGVAAAPDAGSYLVMGNDFGRQLCVQYGTAHIMAVPLEAVPGAPASPAQFVNSSLPEFARCLALLGRMWRLRLGLTPDQAGRWTVDFQAQLAALDPGALASPDHWWAVLLEQMWDGLL